MILFSVGAAEATPGAIAWGSSCWRNVEGEGCLACVGMSSITSFPGVDLVYLPVVKRDALNSLIGEKGEGSGTHFVPEHNELRHAGWRASFSYRVSCIDGGSRRLSQGRG